jgi:hypothetical protein
MLRTIKPDPEELQELMNEGSWMFMLFKYDTCRPLRRRWEAFAKGLEEAFPERDIDFVLADVPGWMFWNKKPFRLVAIAKDNLSAEQLKPFLKRYLDIDEPSQIMAVNVSDEDSAVIFRPGFNPFNPPPLPATTLELTKIYEATVTRSPIVQVQCDYISRPTLAIEAMLADGRLTQERLRRSIMPLLDTLKSSSSGYIAGSTDLVPDGPRIYFLCTRDQRLLRLATDEEFLGLRASYPDAPFVTMFTRADIPAFGDTSAAQLLWPTLSMPPPQVSQASATNHYNRAAEASNSWNMPRSSLLGESSVTRPAKQSIGAGGKPTHETQPGCPKADPPPPTLTGA